MEFDQPIQNHLIGVDFSSGLVLDIAKKEDCILDRISLLEKLAKDKKVIHVGCCDHIPLIQNKIKNKTWLHSILHNSSKRCVGIDINEDGINYLKDNLGYEDVLCGNIIEEEFNIIKEEHWDYMIIGEILEHVDNPCLFLSGVQKKYRGVVDRLVITVPNAFSYQNMKHTFLNQEYINTDHRYWFTPYTLGKIVTLAGMKVEKFFFCVSFPRNNSIFYYINPKNIIFDLICKQYPSTRETLLMVVAV